MGPRKTPRKERGPGIYTNIGQIGRRTGVQLHDTGVRDEHGIEPIPAFSSPEKLPTKTNYTFQKPQNNEIQPLDDSSDAGHSTFIEPLDVVKSVRNSRRSIPRSISPRKSLISGSARRSVGLLSPSKNLVNSSPPKSPFLKPPNRQLDFSKENSRPDGDLSATKAFWDSPKSIFSKKRGTKRPFDLSGLDDGEEEAINTEHQGTLTNGHSDNDYAPYGGDDEPIGESLFNKDPGDEHVEISIEHDDQDIDGLPGPFDEPALMPDVGSSFEDSDRRAPEAPIFDADSLRVSVTASPPTYSEARRKGAREESYEDENTRTAPQSRSKKKGKKIASEPQRSIKPKVVARPKSAAPSGRAGSVGPGRTYIVQRSETPATDDGVYKTRSGRTCYKPLAAWRGEKAIFGQRPDRETPAPLTDIIRTEEVVIPTQPKKKPRRRARAPSELEEIAEEPEEQPEYQLEYPHEEEIREQLDPWEVQDGIRNGLVMAWNQEAQKYDEEHDVEVELAYAADAIELRDVAGGDFKLAKTLTMNFFGCGLVRLPPRSVKRLKNSRKMQMVFFVHEGRVTVTVANEQFGIGKGGQWLVPRGNFYGIANESYDKECTLFFAQGCEYSSKLAQLEAAMGDHSRAD